MRKPARSLLITSSVSNRSVPNWHTSANGVTCSRTMAFMPWVSDTDRWKAAWRIHAKTAVTTLRGQGRVSTESGWH